MEIWGPTKDGFLFMVCGFVEILTASNLRRMGTVIMEWCFMCKNYNWSSLFEILIMEYGKLKCQILKSSYDWSSLSSSFPILGSQKTSFVFFCFSIVAFLFSFMIVLYSYVFCQCIQHLFFFQSINYFLIKKKMLVFTNSPFTINEKTLVSQFFQFRTEHRKHLNNHTDTHKHTYV